MFSDEELISIPKKPNVSVIFNINYIYKLTMANVSGKTGIDIKWIRENLNTKIIGNTILNYDSVDSTNAIARKMAEGEKEEGTVVLAKMQKRGKGRLDRKWFSPKGGLWFSIILRPNIDIQEATKLTLMTSVAVTKTLINLYNLDAKIKWPNDILVKGKKVCGILSEGKTQGNKINFFILGIGVNANFTREEFPVKIRDFATTLKEELGKTSSLEELLLSLLNEIDKYYLILSSDNTNKILNTWKKMSDTLGKNVKITTQKDSLEGLALDVDDMGALIVKSKDNTIKKFLAGDCLHVSESLG